MPISTCQFRNPVGNDPPVPIPDQALALAPIQGDHVFGDIIGMIQTALQNIFGGGQNWINRFQSYNMSAYMNWISLSGLNLGHAGVNEPLVTRQGVAEIDQHAYCFGRFSERFQWAFCEIVCSGYNQGVEQRTIFVGNKSWRRNVMGRFDGVLDNLVDSTALTWYFHHPNQIRQAANDVIHQPISLQVARQQATVLHNNRSARVIQICQNIDNARASLEGLLMRFSSVKATWDGVGWYYS